MNLRLQEEIQEARREIRKASGVPLSPEERVEEQRTAAVEAMNRFTIEAISYRLLLQLKADCLWTDRGAAAQFRVDDQVFHLYQQGQSDMYQLYLLRDQEQSELMRLKASDPLFSRRLLVAIGDSVSASAAVT